MRALSGPTLDCCCGPGHHQTIAYVLSCPVSERYGDAGDASAADGVSRHWPPPPSLADINDQSDCPSFLKLFLYSKV